MPEKSEWDRSYIPEVPEKEIRARAKTIKPVIAGGAKGLHYIKEVDLFNVAYTWNPKPTKPATGLEPIQDIKTYHEYGYYGLFKPSIAEVLAQIPEKLLKEVVAFQLVGWPKTASDLNEERDALDAGYHVATARLYRKAKKE